jgi:hypothetical protein
MKVGDTINVIRTALNYNLSADPGETVPFREELVPSRVIAFGEQGFLRRVHWRHCARRSRFEARLAAEQRPWAELGMTTPEDRIKDAVKRAIAPYKATGDVYSFMPVQARYRAPGPDFYICAFGRFLAIETKAPGKKSIARQTLTINELCPAGAKVFVIDSMDTSALKAWLKVTSESNPHEPDSAQYETAADRRTKRRSAEGAAADRARNRYQRRHLSHDAARRDHHALAPLPRVRGARAYTQLLRVAR